MTQDRPDAPDLLEAVAEYLFTEVRGAVPREQRFRVLVAANVCAVAAREWRAGEGPLVEDLELFRMLLGEGEGEGPAEVPSGAALRDAVREAEARLCRMLRSGELDERLDPVAAELRDHVRRKLAIARPGYDGARQGAGG